MRYTVLHRGVPIGFAELPPGELAAGPFAALPALAPLRDTVRRGSQALLALGFFGAATKAGQNGVGEALRKAADLEFELMNEAGRLIPATFVNLIEAPEGGLVLLARFGHAHSGVGAVRKPHAKADSGEEQGPDGGDV